MPTCQVKYGSYEFTAGLVGVRLDKATRFSQRNVPQSEVVTMMLNGTLIADGQSAIDSAVRELEEAFSQHNRDLILHLADGSVSRHRLTSANSLSGVQIIQPPSFPKGDGAELATGRTFTITARAEYALSGGDPLVSFQESVSVRGNGGPQYALRKVVSGPPQLHQIHAQTPVFITQQGSAVGWTNYPVTPSPIQFGIELGEQRVGERGSPTFNGRTYRNYPIRWTYQFVHTINQGVPDPTRTTPVNALF